jgi:hypothetical protein
MSAPPVKQPEPQRNSASAQPQTQVSPQLLTAKPMGPLGPASHLQSQTATAAPASTSAPPQNQIANQPQSQTSVQKPVQTQNAPAAQQQTRWPDALSRARQNAANGGTPSAQQPTATAPAAQGSEDAANKNKEADSKNTERAANADDQNRAKASRHDRHSRRWHDARSYDRLYDSYGNARRQFYRVYRDDQDDAAARSDQSRSDQRQYGRDTRSRGRSRDIVRDQPDESDRGQSFETSRRRPEPFWGGGFFRRGYQDDD